MRHHRLQSGAALVVSLIMLMILTLLVVSAIQSSNTNLRIAGNMQAQAEASAAVEDAIEQVLSSDAIFKTPAQQNINVGAYAVQILTPKCIMAKTVKNADSTDPGGNFQDGPGGGGGGAATGYLDTYWDVPATVTDTTTGASVEHHQGVRIRLPANPNPCP